MFRLLLRLCLCAVAIASPSCGLKKSTNARTIVLSTKDENLEQPRRAAFTADDVSKVDLLPAKGEFEPWNNASMRLVGTFKDGSQAVILEDVTWTIPGAGSDLIFDKAAGTMASSKEANYDVTAAWGSFKATGKLVFKYIAGSAFEVLPPPINVDVVQTGRGKVKLSWILPVEYISAYALAYSDGSTPTTCLAPVSAPPAGVVFVGADQLTKDLLTYEVSGLNATGHYNFRLCSTQTISIGAKKIERESAGVVKAVQLVEPPTPTP